MAEGGRRPIRILLMADSHLGFDLPTRPRVERRRRGHDFLDNHRKALEAALTHRVDLVVHGGDLFHRPRVPPSLVFQAFQPMLAVAEAGIPLFLVPGNHERGRIPHARFGSHPNIQIFREPTTFPLEVRDTRVALSGFPYHPRGIRDIFPGILEETEWREGAADLRFLCLHHCVEGARVGPGDFTFRNAPDVIRGGDLPRGFAAILSGHIHRHQRLDRDLRGRHLPGPVVYPGSVERTAFAEVGEEKGFLILEARGGPNGGTLLDQSFVDLSPRPMAVIHLDPPKGGGARWSPGSLGLCLRERLMGVPPDSVLQVRIRGHLPPGEREAVFAANLRKDLPREMNIQLILEEDRASGATPGERRRALRARKRERSAPPPSLQHALPL